MAALRAQGLTHKEIAEDTKFSVHHVKAILANEKIKELVKEGDITIGDNHLMEPQEVLERAAPKAMLLLEQVITDSNALGDTCPSIKDRINASLEVLGMLGYSKQVKVSHTHASLRPNDFDTIKKMALAGMQEAEVIDVDTRSVEALPS